MCPDAPPEVRPGVSGVLCYSWVARSAEGARTIDVKLKWLDRDFWQHSDSIIFAIAGYLGWGRVPGYGPICCRNDVASCVSLDDGPACSPQEARAAPKP